MAVWQRNMQGRIGGLYRWVGFLGMVPTCRVKSQKRSNSGVLTQDRNKKVGAVIKTYSVWSERV